MGLCTMNSRYSKNGDAIIIVDDDFCENYFRILNFLNFFLKKNIHFKTVL